MPIYEYRCLSCENIQEVLVVGKENREETPTCSSCGGTTFQKIMSAANSRMTPSRGDRSSPVRCCGAESPRGDCIPGSCCGTEK